MRFFDVYFKGEFTLKKKYNVGEFGYNPDDEGNLIYNGDDNTIVYGDQIEYNTLGGYKYIGDSEVKLTTPLLKSYNISETIKYSKSKFLYFEPLRDWNLSNNIILDILYQYPISGSNINLDFKFYDITNKLNYYYKLSVSLPTPSGYENKLEVISIPIKLLSFTQIIEITRITDSYINSFNIVQVNFSQPFASLNLLSPFPIINISTNYTILESNSGTHFTTFNNADIITITLPVPKPGLFFSISKDTVYDIIIQTPQDKTYTYINSSYMKLYTMYNNLKSGFISVFSINTRSYNIQEHVRDDCWNYYNSDPRSVLASSYSSTFTDELKRIKAVNSAILPVISNIHNFLSPPLCSGGILNGDGCIYMVSHITKTLLKLTVDELIHIKFTDIIPPLIGISPHLAYTAYGEIITLPSTLKNIIKINVDSYKHSVSSIYTDIYTVSPNFVCGICAPNGSTYLIPHNSAVIYNFQTSSVPSVILDSIKGWYGACIGIDENIYLIPYNSNSIAKFKPTTRTISYYGAYLGVGKWVGGAIDRYGNIYSAPHNSSNFLKITPGINPIFNTFGNFGSDLGKWAGAVLGPDGNIYCIPCNSEYILKIIPGIISTDNPTYELLPLPDNIKVGDKKWFGGILSIDGNIYGIPYNSTTFLKIGFNNLIENYSIHYLLSSYLNKF
jgi:hypothetical protein